VIKKRQNTMQEVAGRLRGLPEGFSFDVALVCPFCTEEKFVVASCADIPCVVHEKPACAKFEEIEDPADFLRACRLKLVN
jgi:hypothetical protein